MVLKRIDAFGFKSFPDRVSIEFPKGITAIVGPNGCGKSNISDSIKWVLGEQSAKSLRGEKMEDVIFSGTSTRPPLGVAEVVITFDNANKIFPLEFSEVSIGRRLFRDGQSNYLLNGKECRLKDVHDLLMDSGIGRRTHAIIEQGKIDEIVTAKPEQRRQIIEEAAGISKYRARRAEAFRKLEATREGLKRVDDLIAELERQENSLNRQAKKAQRYREAETELRDLEISDAAVRVNELKLSREEMRVRKQELSDQLVEAEAAVGRLSAQSAEKEERLSAIREELRARGTAASEAERALSTAEAKLEEVETRRLDDERMMNQLSGEVATLSARETEDASVLESERAASNELARELELLEEKYKVAREDWEKSESSRRSLEGRLRELNGVHKTLGEDLVRIQTGLAHAQQKLHQLQEEKALAEVACAHLENEKVELEKERGVREHQCTSLENEIEDLKEEISVSERRRDEFSGLIEQRMSEQSRQEEKAEGLRMRLSAAASRAASEAEELHRQAPELDSDAIQPMAEVLSCDSKYTTAFSAALGESMGGVVVSGLQIEEILEKGLSDKWPGRSIFASEDIKLLHESWRPRSGLAPLRAKLGADVPRPLWWALSGWYVAESSSEALQALGRLDERERIVTLSGTVLYPYGAARQSHQADADQLAEGRRLLKDQISSAEERLAALGSEIRSFRDQKAGIEAEIEDQKEGYKGLEELRSEIRYGLAEIQEKLRNDRFEEARQAVIDTQREIVESAQQLEQNNGEMARVTSEEESIRYEIEQAEKDFDGASDAAEYARDTFSGIQREIEVVRERYSASVRDIEGIEKRIQSLRGDRERYEGMVEEVRARRVEYDDRASSLKAQIAEITTDLDEKRSRLARTETDVREAESELGEINRELKRRASDREGLQQRIHDIDLESAEKESEIRILVERIRDRYSIEILEVAPPEDFSPDSGRIAELREMLSRMGAVNFAAEEEMEEVAKRAVFYRDQRQDLVKADEDLSTVVKDIDRKTISLFNETFKAVNSNFGLLFNRLFTATANQEGSAELILLDPENPLESGVDIVAMPPGKKPQSISLLSGGEKAMTAIALLFSVFLVRPSPFAILDELDAPLDEANVERYAKILREFAQRSQFIVVTHNKRTMEVANTLYGVAMPERGVTSIFGVKLSEAEEMSQAG